MTAKATSHVPRNDEEQVRLDDAIRKLHEEGIVFNQVFALKVVSLDPKQPKMRFEMKPDLVGHAVYGRLHGGVIASVLDTTGGLGLMVGLGQKFVHETAEEVMKRFLHMGTIDLRIDFLRPGIGQWFEASVNVTRLGGRIASTQMALVNDSGVLIATAAGSYIVS